MKVSPPRKRPPPSEVAGLWFALLAALIAALMPAFVKLTTSRATPLFAAAATSAFAAALGMIVLAVRGELHVLFARRTGPRLFGVGALGTATAFVLLFEGTHRTSAIEATLCLQIEPAYALLIAWIFLGHRPTRRRILGVVALLAGIALAIEPRGFSSAVGVALLLSTPLAWQVSHVIVLRSLPGVRPPALTTARYLYGGALLVAYWMARGATVGLDPAIDVTTFVALLAFQGMGLCFVGTIVWYEAISRLDLARTTAIVVPLVPVLSLAASFVLLGEVATTRQWIGVALTVAGVVAFATAPDAERLAARRAPLPPPPLGKTAVDAHGARKTAC